MRATEAFYTTGEVAKVCNVTIRTVIKWFSEGRLEGHTIPGSGFRRISKDSLLHFLKENGFPTEGIDGTSTRVLVVDDDEDYRMIFRQVLIENGYEVRTAEGGFEAGVIAKEFRPHLLILDIVLKDIDGRQVCQTMRKDHDLKDCKIVGMSGYMTNSEIQAILADGFDDFLEKPVRPTALLRKVKQVLNTTHSQK